jgi:hypothetical protein
MRKSGNAVAKRSEGEMNTRSSRISHQTVGGEGKVGMEEHEQRSGGKVMGGCSIRGHRCCQVKYEELTPWWDGGMLISYDVNDWHWRV